MYTNIPAVTVWELTVADRSPAYVRHVTGAAYWQRITAQRITDTERRPADEALCILHRDCIGAYLPRPDDRIAPGVCEDARPPADALTVTAVKDFRFGSDRVQHIEVSAK